MIFPDEAELVSVPVGTEKIFAARQSDSKIVYFTGAQLFAALLKLKTINGHSLIGTENLVIEGGSSGPVVIEPWEAGTYGANVPKTHVIDGVRYLFVSKEAGNTDEPALGVGTIGVQAWINKGAVNYTLWGELETYSINEWIVRDGTGYGLGYRFYSSVINSNTDNDPFSDPDEGGTHWKLEGTLVTPFVAGTPYKKKDIHQAIDGTIYISDIPNNTYDLTEIAPPWTQINTTDPINTWSSLTTYAKNRCVRRTFTDGSGSHNFVWQSLNNGNLDINPISDNGVNWRYVGNYKGTFDELVTYALYDVTVTPSGLSYVSNQNANDYALDTPSSTSSWAVISGGPMTGAEIRAALSITTLSGSNTGDQDISGKVDKMTGKSLILDTEIARLASVTNQDISGKQDIITLTTTGTSGAATLTGGALNIPNYAGGGGGVSLGETLTTAYRGDRGKVAYDHSIITTGNPHGTTKTDIGLGSVDNTTDLGKPVSTAQQSALDLKAPLANPAFTGTVTGVTKSMVGLGSVDNTADSAKPVSTAQQSAIDAKVADNLTASTTIAPSATAVNTALGGKVNTDGAKVLSDVNFSTAKDTKLSGIAPSATANDTDANLKARANHTGTQAATTIVEDSTHRFATDAEKTTWAAKEPVITAGTSAQFWLGDKTWGTIITTVLGVVLTGLSTATSTAVVATDTILAAIGKLQAQITLRATLASPTFTGTPTLPTGTIATTQSAGDSSTKVATTAFVTTADALKANIAPTVGSSAALAFASDNIQGSVGTPLTGNITGVTTAAVVGVVVHVVHNSGTAPTFDSKFKKLSGSGTYVISVINHIYCEYMSATEILYTIQQRT